MSELRICPVDRITPLIIIERNGIEIDYCSACRGVWLDRGELEKILEVSSRMTAQAVQYSGAQPGTPAHDPLMPPPTAYPSHDPAPPMQQTAYGQVPPAYKAEKPHGYCNSGGWESGKRRRRGWLDDIFDFD